MANTPFREKDKHNPSAQNIEIIEWVQLKGNQNHFPKIWVYINLVDGGIWDAEAVGSSPATQTACELTSSPVTIDASID